MIKPLPHWVLTNNQPAFYDTESVTAIEMVAKLYGKMEELITSCNEQDKKIDEAIKYMTDNIVEVSETIFNEYLNEGKIYVSLAEDYNAENESLTLGIAAIPSEELLADLSTLATVEEGE